MPARAADYNCSMPSLRLSSHPEVSGSPQLPEIMFGVFTYAGTRLVPYYHFSQSDDGVTCASLHLFRRSYLSSQPSARLLPMFSPCSIWSAFSIGAKQYRRFLILSSQNVYSAYFPGHLVIRHIRAPAHPRHFQSFSTLPIAAQGSDFRNRSGGVSRSIS